MAQDEDLRQALITTQREAVDRYRPLPTTMSASWSIRVGQECFTWNPINPVPPGGTHLIFELKERQ